MWTIVRFALEQPGDGYRHALDLLSRAGFQPHRSSVPGEAGGCALPGAAVADLFQDPAVVSRAIFEALQEAGLRPVAVSGCHVDVGGRGRRAGALAPG